MSETVFLLAFAMAGSTLVLVAKAIAGAISGRKASHAELAEIRERLDQQAADLDNAQAGAADQAAQIVELQERLDFAERVLTQRRDPSSLGPGESR